MQQKSSATLLAFSGFIALAVAMGIGRFAFTPLLPMMQQDVGLGLAEGGWLASANYLGYLVGALIAIVLPSSPATLLRTGLILVVATTALMGITDNWLGWLTWRFIAGAASAWVLVSTTSLCLTRLAALGQPQKAGVVFAGVGSGIALAGLLCMGMGLGDLSSSAAWLVLALFALAGAWSTRSLWADAVPAPKAAATPQTSAPAPARNGHWRLILCYGIFGFGYILPGTFLPAQARLLVADPAIFGLAWPAFGLSAAISTLMTGRLVARYPRRRIWAACQLIMTAGVLLPVLWHTLSAIVIAALCVGGAFMVITMVGLQEAQAVGSGNGRKLIAALTASFAAGQLIGPLFFSLTHSWFGAQLEHALILAAVLLVLGSIWLISPEGKTHGAHEPTLPGRPPTN